MTTLVLGATGNTGKHLVQELLKMNQKVKVMVRNEQNLPDNWKGKENLAIIQASISELSVEQLSPLIKDCNAVASCLGHNISFKGLYGKPRLLVHNAVKLACDAINANNTGKPVKIVLMNTAGNRNRDLNEPITVGERMVIALLRLLLPPHPDNEKAADYLRINIGQNNPKIEWVAVRPDDLINKDEVTPYKAYVSPIRSSLFNAGKTSRINVGNFMARLITDNSLWQQWKGQMPVQYNTDE